MRLLGPRTLNLHASEKKETEHHLEVAIWKETSGAVVVYSVIDHYSLSVLDYSWRKIYGYPME